MTDKPTELTEGPLRDLLEWADQYTPRDFDGDPTRGSVLFACVESAAPAIRALVEERDALTESHYETVRLASEICGRQLNPERTSDVMADLGNLVDALRADLEKAQRDVKHWREARQATWEGGEMLRVECERLRADLRAACDMRDGAMATAQRLEHERDEARTDWSDICDRLPHCVGEWIGGSGGHRKHAASGCIRLATWYMPGDLYAYCDEHKKPHDVIAEAPWAGLLRDLHRSREAERELRGALEQALTLCRCRGTGKYETSCTLCGDSTFDHQCNDTERACDRTACVAARTALSRPRPEGDRAVDPTCNFPGHRFSHCDCPAPQRPATHEELERLLQSEDGTPIEILPNGNVRPRPEGESGSEKEAHDQAQAETGPSARTRALRPRTEGSASPEVLHRGPAVSGLPARGADEWETEDRALPVTPPTPPSGAASGGGDYEEQQRELEAFNAAMDAGEDVFAPTTSTPSEGAGKDWTLIPADRTEAEKAVELQRALNASPAPTEPMVSLGAVMEVIGGLLSRLRAAEARAASLEAKLAEVEGAVAKRIAGELREEALGLRGVTWGKSVAEAQASVLERAADRIDPPKAEGR